MTRSDIVMEFVKWDMGEMSEEQKRIFAHKLNEKIEKVYDIVFIMEERDDKIRLLANLLRKALES